MVSLRKSLLSVSASPLHPERRPSQADSSGLRATVQGAKFLSGST